MFISAHVMKIDIAISAGTFPEREITYTDAQTKPMVGTSTIGFGFHLRRHGDVVLLLLLFVLVEGGGLLQLKL